MSVLRALLEVYNLVLDLFSQRLLKNNMIGIKNLAKVNKPQGSLFHLFVTFKSWWIPYINYIYVTWSPKKSTQAKMCQRLSLSSLCYWWLPSLFFIVMYVLRFPSSIIVCLVLAVSLWDRLFECCSLESWRRIHKKKLY